VCIICISTDTVRYHDTTGPAVESEVSGATQQSSEPRSELSPMHTTRDQGHERQTDAALILIKGEYD